MALDESQKKAYLERYKAAKEHGVRFFPDIVYKDLLVALALFLLLIGLATFIGVAKEPPADPNDTAYVPRPEWYFLWLFQLLKYFPGNIEWVGTTLVPAIGVLLLLLLPFYDRSPFRHIYKRPLAYTVLLLSVAGVAALTVLAVESTPPAAEAEAVATTLSEQILAGQDLYAVHCAECHGDEGDATEVIGVEGLEGTPLTPINSADVMYTRTDETLYNVIDRGQQDLGMPPFGLGFGGELSVGEIDSIVAFMRYSWDDRVEMPAEVAAVGTIPPLAEGEVPSYDVHVAPIFRRTCVSCHRPGKKNGNYHMETYEEVLETGDFAPNVIAGAPDESNLVLMVRRVEGLEAGRPMPPGKALKAEWVDVLERWVAAGMPRTAEDAAKATSP